MVEKIVGKEEKAGYEVIKSRDFAGKELSWDCVIYC